jgi:hypothetical protein
MRQFLLITGLFVLIHSRDTYCKDCNDSITKKIYYDAFNNRSTAPDYVVFIAVDLKTNESKEICCESDQLYEAYLKDNLSNKDSATLFNTYKKAIFSFDSILISLSCDYTFSFKSSEALSHVGYYNYKSDSLDYYSSRQTIQIINSIRKDFRDKPIALNNYYRYISIYLIHILNKEGVLCGRDCVSGSRMIREIIK